MRLGARIARGPDKKSGAVGIAREEFPLEIEANLVGRLADARANRGNDACFAGAQLLHGHKSGLQNPANGPAPSGMGRGNDPGLGIREQHGGAIGR